MNLRTVRLCELQEVWESFSGWYWFVTEYHEGSLAFGLVKGWEVEWGYFDLAELRQLKRQAKVWKVPKKNWALCPCVVDNDAVLCSRERCIPKHRAVAVRGEQPGRGTVPRRVAQTQGVANANAGLHFLSSERRCCKMDRNITEASLCPVKIGSGYVLDVHGVWLYCSREELERLLRLGLACTFHARTG